jgi:two-component system invasion response regulator UvrY
MIHILCADDHPVIRAGLRQILSSDDELVVVTEVSTGDDVLAALERHRVDVLVLDVGMPGMPFVDLLREVVERHPAMATLVLSVYPEEQYAIEALRHGAAGYLNKNQSPDYLVQAVKTVASGRRFVTDKVADILLRAVTGEDDNGVKLEESDSANGLTAREQEVFELLGEGLSTKQVARRLKLSPKTVATHRAAILRKLGLRNSAALIHYYVTNLPDTSRERPINGELKIVV